MRKHLLGLMLIAGLAGCTVESDGTLTGVTDVAPNGGVTAPATRSDMSASAASFASLPDRGELLAYGGGRQARQTGAYTWHPVAISEAHALSGIAKREMTINLPSGKPLRLAYERHEEQPDGNWTWIGRNPDGTSAVLTFGDKAVFGVVSHGEDVFRVRTDATGAWIVATDRTRLAPGRQNGRSDVLLPPEGRALAAAASRRVAEAAASGTVNEKAGFAVVDVLIGYAGSLSTSLGSDAAAVTRLSNLVAMTNAAYQNSGVTMRLRLVHALKVDYADTSDNRDALQKLTGYNATTNQPITVDPAFAALRTARGEFGADLVAFVRSYREPEQNGCGIAWLLGAGKTPITTAADAEFGYAVVSDGLDIDETDNNRYFCSEFSLAHELGHLMGQAHNTEDAQGVGAHDYSYGYREATATGFHTIMAYPASDTMIEAPHFANPAVNYLNRRTGVANASDNVRSMNQTMPLIAQFRATVVPLIGRVATDFDGDGKSDILFRNTGTGQNVIWKSGNNATQQGMTTVAGTAWTIAGTGDFNADGKVDVLWRNTVTGQNTVWRGAGSATPQTIATVADQNWKVAGIGDFNGDGAADILWRHAVTGKNVIWAAGNSASQVAVATVADRNWAVGGIGDFNGDGRDDILWNHVGTGQSVIWRSGSSAAQQAVARLTDLRWKIAGVGDFNGDGVDDVLWRNSGTGANAIWRGAVSTATQVTSSAGTAWRVASIGDYDGDGRDDILWRNAGSGQNTIWKSGSSATVQGVASVPSQAWQVYD